jgi:ABC-2 type transport system permease protein
MKAVLSIVWKEFVQLRRDPRLFPVLFISPVLQILLLGYAANLDVRRIPSVVCDLDRSAASRAFLDEFVNSGYFAVRARPERTADIDPYIDNGQAAIAFIVPRGFGDKLAGGRPASVMIIADGSESQTATIGVNYAAMIAGQFRLPSPISAKRCSRGAAMAMSFRCKRGSRPAHFLTHRAGSPPPAWIQ